MREKVATLEIWYDDETDNVSRLENEFDEGEHTARLVLNPALDDQHLLGEVKNKRGKFAAVIAHELGHFVAVLMRSKWQHPIVGALAKLPGEKEAWNIAHYITPNINAEVQEMALASYEKPVCTCGREDCKSRHLPPEWMTNFIDAKFEETKLL